MVSASSAMGEYPAGCSKSSSSKAAAEERSGGVASGLRRGCFRGENAAGGLF